MPLKVGVREIVMLYYTMASANSGGKTILGGKSHTRKNGIFTTSYTSKYLVLTYEFSLRPNSLQLLLFQLPSTITILMNEARTYSCRAHSLPTIYYTI